MLRFRDVDPSYPAICSVSDSCFCRCVPQVTEGNAESLLGPNISHRIFKDILPHTLNVPCSYQCAYQTIEAPRRDSSEAGPYHILTTLKNRSQANRLWADMCRQHDYLDRVLEIRSHEDSMTSNSPPRYAVQGFTVPLPPAVITPRGYDRCQCVSRVKQSIVAESPLGSTIPSELLKNIVSQIQNAPCSTRCAYRSIDSLRRTPSKVGRGRNGLLTCLKNCSLVNRFWANICRRHIFLDRVLEIRSFEEAEIFRRYAVEGCTSLIPVHQLIGCIEVYQDYQSRISFLHLLYLPAIRDKLKLHINGPIPNGFHPAKLDTPHWGLPPSLVLPASFMQNTSITMKNIHLPSFNHITRYITHCALATTLEFGGITWDDGGMPLTRVLLPRTPNAVTRRRKLHSKTISAYGGTNNIYLSLTAAMLDPYCPLHHLSDIERLWMMEFSESLWDNDDDPYVYIVSDVRNQETSVFLGYDFRFIFEDAPVTDQSSSTLTIVGIHTYIADRNKLPLRFDTLVDLLRTRSSIRVLVLLFKFLDKLEQAMKPYCDVFDPAAQDFQLVLGYDRTTSVVGIDPVTLQRTGRLWRNLSGREYENSEEVLRRELSKRTVTIADEFRETDQTLSDDEDEYLGNSDLLGSVPEIGP